MYKTLKVFFKFDALKKVCNEDKKIIFLKKLFTVSTPITGSLGSRTENIRFISTVYLIIPAMLLILTFFFQPIYHNDILTFTSPFWGIIALILKQIIYSSIFASIHFCFYIKKYSVFNFWRLVHQYMRMTSIVSLLLVASIAIIFNSTPFIELQITNICNQSATHNIFLKRVIDLFKLFCVFSYIRFVTKDLKSNLLIKSKLRRPLLTILIIILSGLSFVKTIHIELIPLKRIFICEKMNRVMNTPNSEDPVDFCEVFKYSK